MCLNTHIYSHKHLHTRQCYSKMLVLLLLPVSTASLHCSPAALTLLPPVSSPLPTSQLGKGQGRGQAGCFPSVSASENIHRWPELWAYRRRGVFHGEISGVGTEGLAKWKPQEVSSHES